METYNTRSQDYEVFYSNAGELTGEDGAPLAAGEYWWACFPAWLPGGVPCGPFDTEADATADIQNFE